MCLLSESPRRVEGTNHSLTEQVRAVATALFFFAKEEALNNFPLKKVRETNSEFVNQLEVSSTARKSGAGYSHSQLEGVDRSTTEG
jgi:hypothetical protein